MADVAFDLLGDASIHSTPSRDTNNNLLAHNGAGAVLKDEEDAFSAAVTVWRGIQLPVIQQEMDTQSVELLEQQQQSLAGRKKLAELTREFKKVPDQEKLQQFKLLLRAYQGEIDAITKREKATAQAFLTVYNALGQAPDPAKLLQVAADQTTKLEEISALQAENIRLKEENTSLNKQAANLRSMSSNTTKLQQRLTRLETKQEETIQEKVREKEQAFREEWEEKIRTAKEREHDLQRQLNQAKDQLKTLKHTNDSTQATLVDHSQKYEEEVVAKLAELDIVLLDYERANSRISELEGQNELLRDQLDNSQGRGIDSERAATLEQTIENQDAELQNLTTALENLKTSSKKQITTLERKTTALQREVQERTEEIETTKRKLEQYKDYETVKSELEVLKYIEFSGSRGVDADDDWDERVLTLASKNLEKPIEILLMEKNRKLENELTELKVLHESVTRDLEDVRTRHEVASRQLGSQMELIQRLEEDITRLNQPSGNGLGAGNGGVNGYFTGPPGTNPSGFPHPTSPPFGKASFSGDVVGGVTLGPVLPQTPRTPGFPSAASFNLDGSAAAGGAGSGVGTPGVGSSSADHSILPIVTSQRDRFRQRNSELEEQLRQQSEQISNLRNETSQLQRDNLKLYEKIKYMQSYRDEASGSGVGAGYSSVAPSAVIDYTSPFRNNNSGGMVGRPGQHKKDDRDEMQMQSLDPTDRYRNIYEESMNPFEAFHKKEESRRFNSMTPADKAMLTMSRLVLTNKWTRSMLVAYTMGLHFLMMIMLYKMSAWEECRHDHETPNGANPMMPPDE
ncbi:MAG: CASP C terminal-domain-containing protein [Linnemannia elongata]|nr:MAG: CASP C terminal-domain-containing protein [Linnemannia elongata]